MNPCVSVILPVLTADRFLCQAINSLKNQTLENFECLVCFSGNKSQWPESLAGGDPRFRILHMEGETLARALATGVEMAAAPFIARMDADDIALPNRLEYQCRELSRQPETALLGCAWRVIDGEGREIRKKFPPRAPSLPKALLWGCPFLHPGVMLRKESLLAAGNYRAFFSHAEDYDLWFRLSRLGALRNMPEILMKYRIHDANKSRAKAATGRRYSMMAQGLFLLGASAPPPDEWNFESIMGRLSPRVRADVILRMLACNAPHTGDEADDPEGAAWFEKYSRIASPSVARKARVLWRLHCGRRYLKKDASRAMKHLLRAIAGK